MSAPTTALEAALPPQNLEAERSVLGALMIDKNAIIKIVDFLVDSDFYKKQNQLIFTSIVELFKKGEPIDLLSVSNRLKEKGDLDNVGGMTYLTDLINFVPTASHISSYAKIVRKKRILRDLIETSQQINEMGYSQEEDVDTILDQAEHKIFSIAQKSITKGFVSVRESLGEAFERIDKLSKHTGDLRGVTTGFRDLDAHLSGLQKSDLIILAARPSIGKTSLALDIASNVAINDKVPVGIFSLEMSNDQLIDKLISKFACVDLWKLRTGKLSSEGDDNDFSRIQQAMGILSEADIYVDDAASVNVLQVRAMARRLQAERGLGLIVIDYIQLMQPTNSNASPVQQVSEISRSLKIMARELNVPVIALSQLSRAVEQRIPQIPRLSDLRESGSLEQDADIVLFIYREDRYREDTTRKNIADVIIAKHRNGPVGKVELFFDEQRTSFKNMAKDDYSIE